VRKGKNTNQQLGDPTSNLEGNGGREGDGSEKSIDKKAAATAVELPDGHRST